MRDILSKSDNLQAYKLQLFIEKENEFVLPYTTVKRQSSLKRYGTIAIKFSV